MSGEMRCVEILRFSSFFKFVYWILYCRFVGGTEQGSGMVLLLSTGQKVSEWASIEQGNDSWVLEGNWEGS